VWVDVAAAAVFAQPPLPLVLAEAATSAVLARAPLQLVLADALSPQSSYCLNLFLDDDDCFYYYKK